jgi:hypothetical protein
MDPNTQWFYAQDGRQNGPLALDQARNFLSQGTIRPSDLVWREGMSQWQTAGQIPELGTQTLSTEIPAPAAAVFPATPASPAPSRTTMPFNPLFTGSGIPPRAEENLYGFPPPQGDISDWPLDDARVEQFHATIQLRKKVRSAAALYRILLLVATVAAVFLLIIAFGVSASNKRMPPGASFVLGLVALLFVGITALYYFAWRGTLKSQRWAPLTMFILFMLSATMNLFAMLAASSSPQPANMIAPTLSFIVAAAFGTVSWKSYNAIPEFLKQPAWCQELIAKAGL